jgi:protein required for attachment to host cells
MSRPVNLPDAMPDVKKPTLLLVCDTHHCKFIDVGGHRIVEQEIVESKEEKYTDRQTSVRGPSGVLSGVGDATQAEQNRLRDFASTVGKRLDQAVRSLKIKEIHIAAPARLLSYLKKYLSKEVAKLVLSEIDGNYVKEPLLKVLLRFRPDLEQSLEALRDEENYSPKRHLPKKEKK